MAIESVLFAYKALGADAKKISIAVDNSVKDKIVVIATPADFAGLVQWRNHHIPSELVAESGEDCDEFIAGYTHPAFIRWRSEKCA